MHFSNKAEFLLCLSQMFIGHWDIFFCQAGVQILCPFKKDFYFPIDLLELFIHSENESVVGNINYRED